MRKRILPRWFWLGCGTAGLALVVFFLVGSGLFGWRLYQFEWKTQGRTALRFEPVSLPFTNVSDIAKKTGSLPFMAAVVLDVDGDGRDEAFLGGGRTQQDALLSYDDTAVGFRDIARQAGLSKTAGDATMGGGAIDLDGDGAPELFVARESGVFLYRNSGGKFTGANLGLPIDATATPLSIAFGDINRDGKVDFYLSGYLRNDLVEGQTKFTDDYGGYSYLFVNNGDDSWRDATEEYGLKRQHNTFTALFSDFDNDGDGDLAVAQDTGHVETWENAGAAPMRRIENPSVYSYPMGIAAGDINDDGLTDLYFSNVGPTIPEAIVRGDLPPEAPFNTDYMLFENRGALKFEDAAKQFKAARIGFGWGVVAADLDLDGWEDLTVAQNYAKFGQEAIIHRYGCKILRNQNGENFAPVEKRAGAVNRRFAISPMIGDYDGDGLPDLIWANLNGPSQAFLNRTPNAKSIRLAFADNVASLNARVEILAGGRTLHREVVSGQGLSSDQTASLFVGLGEAATAERITVKFANGRVEEYANVMAGAVLRPGEP
ncbi:MAG: hypothetical protein A3E78_07745 [Alphaproteobacteria bacterium RIFCSPHIGHO2_12_FULL_63_12]|nr:MAG: hypothetical protein A3E78_07745 [Alphaproteobacteria bacterium RIFCSPHIGHO2_12_FULL_63_12]